MSAGCAVVMDIDREPIVPPSECITHRVYWTRWYVVVMACLSNIINNGQWAYWGPIAQSAKTVYGWTDRTIFVLINITNAAGFVSTFLGCYLVDRKGIRVAVLFCFGCLVLSAASKVFTMETYPATILIGFGQLFNGLATSVTGAIPAPVSETWFPLNERATATAIVALAAGFGSSVSFIIGPLAVSMPTMNGSRVLLNETNVPLIREEIQHLNYAMFGVTVVLFLICCIHFPDKPPSPPTITAASQRFNFKLGILTLIRRRSMWVLAIVYGVGLGSYGSWSSVLDIIVNPLGISQTKAGWLGFYGGVGGVFGGIIMGKIANVFKRRMKLLLIGDMMLVAICFAWFTCQWSGILPRSMPMLYIAAISGTTLISSSIPLFIEIACEASYPIAEGLTSGFLMMHINFAATVFLLVGLIPNIGTAWTNWWLMSVCVVVVPILMLYKVQYQRIEIDIANTVPND